MESDIASEIVSYRLQGAALIQPSKTRDSELNRSPGKVKVIGENEASSESAKEFHNGGVISPPFFDPAIAASWITGSESLSFHG